MVELDVAAELRQFGRPGRVRVPSGNITSVSPARSASTAWAIMASVGALRMYPAARTTRRMKGLLKTATLTTQVGAGVKATMNTTSISVGWLAMTSWPGSPSRSRPWIS